MKRQAKYRQYDFTFLEQILTQTEDVTLDYSFKYLENQNHTSYDDDLALSYLNECWQPKDDL